MPRKAGTRERTRRGFGQVRQWSSGRWAANYSHEGQLWRAPATFPTKDTATAWLVDERKLIDRGDWTPPGERVAKRTAKRLTLREYAGSWLAGKTRLARRTRDGYDRMLDRLILPGLGDMVLAEVTPAVVRSWFAGLGSENETRNAHAYALLNGIFNTALADDLVSANPCRIKGAAQVKHPKRSVVLLDVAQLGELADAMPEELRLAVLLAGWGGLRKGELFALRRCDIAADGSSVQVERAVTYRNGKFEVGPCKTRESRRTVTMPPHLRSVLLDHLDRHVGPADDALVFVDPVTGSFIEWRFRPAWDSARAAIGKPDLHFHDLRHAAGVMAAQTGATTREVMGRLGHTAPGTAMRYQHVAAGRAELLAERLSALAAGLAGTAASQAGNE